MRDERLESVDNSSLDPDFRALCGMRGIQTILR